MSAEEVRRRSFSTAFRGFDQAEVRGFLERVAEELDEGDRREKELRNELRDARDRILHPRLDEETLTSALGQEAAQILHSAHEAAADVRRKAEEHAARILGEAHREGEGIRAGAETVMAERTAEADAAADAIRSAAEVDAAALLGQARQHAEAALLEARGRCDALAQEADTLKGRVLGDLARRRRVMNAQVEQLGAGRETIVLALQEVRRLLDQTVDSLDRVSSDAKVAADEALHRALNEPDAAAEVEREAGPGLASPLEGLAAVLAGLEESLASIAAAGAPAQLGAARAEPAEPAESAAEPPSEPAAMPDEPAIVAVEEIPSAPMSGPPAEVAPSVPEGAAEAEPSGEPEAEILTELERRGSLRLLRRGRPRPPAEATSYAAEPGEGVRLIRSAPLPRAPGEVEEEAQAKGHEAVASDTVVMEPEREGDAPADDTATTDDTATADDKATAVDELFARLRAQRAAAREHAQAVLSEAEAPEGAGQASDASGSAQPDSAGEQAGGEPQGEEAEAPFLEMRNRMLGSVQERMARRLKRTLQDDQNDVLDRVRGMSRGRPGPVLPDEDDHRRTYAAAVAPLVDEAFRAGELFAAEIFPGASSPGASPNGEVADALATEVVVQLRARLTALFDGPEGEEAELADGASAAYRAWKGDRVESLAMDYVVDSFAAGILAAVPSGTALRWVVDDDGGPCPDCDDNALAGPTAAGESFPTGQQHPPAHPGCRCLLAPVPT